MRALLEFNVLFFIGLLIITVAYFWAIVLAFRIDVLWGLGCLFLAFPCMLVFIISYWEKCKQPLFLSLIGFLVCLAGMLVYPAIMVWMNW